MDDLHKNNLNQDILDKFHSSKNLNIDFEKEVAKKKVKEEKAKSKLLEIEEKDTPDENSVNRPSKIKVEDKIFGRVENKIERGVNLFDMGGFKTEESFDYLNVVPVINKEEMEHMDISIQIKQRDKYTLDNPFQGTLKEFIEGNALQSMEEQLEVDRDDDLVDYLNVESDILVKVNQFDGLAPKSRIRSFKPSQEVISIKEKLPVTLKELEIMESAINNLVTIVCGETGSGKSTQIPQFLYETGMAQQGMIAVTQPRRLAAISLAQRVAEETGTRLGDIVGYQVRFEASRFSGQTRIKFMTDGILLNEMMSDFLLTKYSVVVLDEAHERKINTDLLIGLLSRVVRMRAKLSLKERSSPGSQPPYKMNPLRLIIMSATLRTTDFTENKYLFPEEKLNTIQVEARMFPVKSFYDRATPEDYLSSSIKKTVQIHTTLPPGGILVFLTGEEEIRDFCSRLRERLEDMKSERERMFYDIEEDNVAEDEYELKDADGEGENDGDGEKLLSVFDDDVKEMAANGGNNRKKEKKKKESMMVEDYVVYPLYTKLPLEEQQRIFHHFDKKKRLIVVSTNVAETSLTIPNVKYVVDTGREKNKVYNSQMSLGRFEIAWISQSSAKQREGRAGRTCKGYCYRIYSQAAYSKFKDFSDPEILKEPLDSSILALKTIGIQDIMRFPFVTRPSQTHITQAEKELKAIGAIDESNHVTPVGTSLSQLPIKPRLGKMLLMSRRAGILSSGILLVVSLSSEEMFDTRELKQRLSEADFEGLGVKEGKKMKQRLLDEHKKKYEGLVSDKSDVITEMNVMGLFVSRLMKVGHSSGTEVNKLVMDFCKEKSLLFKSMREAYSLMLHLLQIVDIVVVSEGEKEVVRKAMQEFKVAGKAQEVGIIELIVATMTDKAARRVRYLEEGKEKQAFETTEHEVRAQVHPSSFVFSRRPEFLVYFEVIENEKGKVFLARVTEVEDPGLLVKYDGVTGRRVEFLKEPPPRYISAKDRMFSFAKCTFGCKLWEIPLVLTEMNEESRSKYYYFVLGLLSGKVLSSFGVLASRLLVKVDPAPQQEPKLLMDLTDLFMKEKVDRKSKLKQVLHGQKSQIFKQLVFKLLDEKDRHKVDKIWPRIIMIDSKKE